MTEEEKAQHDSDYKALLALFIALLKNLHTDSKEEALYELAELRSQLAITHVAKGLGIDLDEAIMLIKNKDDESLTQHDKDLRDRVMAAVDNLIDFAVCEEYQLYQEVAETVGDNEIDYNSDEYLELEELCEKYNDTYASVEDSDIEYAGKVAATWIGMSSSEYLVYWTQNDAKVRPWHMELQGYAAHRDEFPSWMIPPIEWHCRCFLEPIDVSVFGYNSKIKKVISKASAVRKPEAISGVFKESLAKCGKIFSSEHPYFSVNEADKEMLSGFVQRIREKYYG